MDYGVMLKKAGDNPNRKSAHYQRQSPFEGSDREVRSRVLRVLLQERALTEEELVSRLPADPVRSGRIIRGLEQEGFLACRRGRINRCLYIANPPKRWYNTKRSYILTVRK